MPLGVVMKSSVARSWGESFGCVPCGYLTGQAWLVMHHEGHNVSGESLVPFSPDAPVWESPCTQPGQQGIICHPGYELEALQ